MNDWEFRAQPAPWWNGVQLMVRARTYDGVFAYLKDITVERTEEAMEPPALTMTMKAAQVLMDDLWASGIRPTEKRQDNGALEATKNHLADMQTMTFRLLDDKLNS
ncbi:MAG: hypothetical protein GWN58_47350 [Anaerolineae bacterium]|nr:hypothetical protein [Anaerolineae bacterium]